MIDDVEILQKEISQLRSRLLYYEQHHRHCAIGRQPSPPPDEERIDASHTDCLLVSATIADTVNDQQTQGDNLDGHHPTADATNGLKIITFESQSREQVKPKTKSSQRYPQWRIVADQLVAKVPDAAQWSAKRENLGLRSMKDNIAVISTISGARLDSNHVLLNTNHDSAARIMSDGYSDSPQKTSYDLIALASAYAWMTKRSQVKATLACLLRSFQELVFTSLCAVLERNGTDVGLIDGAMRICISDTDPRNLKRLRHGAVWANRMIVDLAKSKDGWDCYRATEMVLLCGLSISKYGILAASSDSLAHLSGLLRTSKYTKTGSGVLRGGPFLIPAFIKMLVGDNLTLKDICIPLYYEEPFLEQLGQVCSWYQQVLSYPEVKSVEGGKFTKKRKLDDSQSVAGYDVEYSPVSPQGILRDPTTETSETGAGTHDRYNYLTCSQEDSAAAPQIHGSHNNRFRTTVAIITCPADFPAQPISAADPELSMRRESLQHVDPSLSPSIVEGIANYSGTPKDPTLDTGVSNGSHGADEVHRTEDPFNMWEGLDVGDSLDMWEGLEVEDTLHMWEALEDQSTTWEAPALPSSAIPGSPGTQP